VTADAAGDETCVDGVPEGVDVDEHDAATNSVTSASSLQFLTVASRLRLYRRHKTMTDSRWAASPSLRQLDGLEVTVTACTALVRSRICCEICNSISFCFSSS